MTANGTPVPKARIHLPRIGAWHADVVIDDIDATPYENGIKLGIADGAIQLQGTFTRYSVQYGVVMGRIMGGGGGLANVLEPKGYQNTTIGVVLSDICAAAGELLSPVADPATIARQLTWWTRFAGKAGRCIQAVLEDLGVAWRCNLDGSIFVGPETYPPTSMSNALILDPAPEQARVEFYADVPNVFPGESWQGQAVSRVEHDFFEGKLRSRALFEVGT